MVLLVFSISANAESVTRVTVSQDMLYKAQQLRLLTDEASKEKTSLNAAMQLVADMRHEADGNAILYALLKMYQASLQVIQAKYASGILGKTRALSAGLAEINRVVEHYPNSLEARYLRVRCQTQIPSFFSDDKLIENDIHWLVAKLPHVSIRARGETYFQIVDFLLSMPLPSI